MCQFKYIFHGKFLLYKSVVVCYDWRLCDRSNWMYCQRNNKLELFIISYSIIS